MAATPAGAVGCGRVRHPASRTNARTVMERRNGMEASPATSDGTMQRSLRQVPGRGWQRARPADRLALPPDGCCGMDPFQSVSQGPSPAVRCTSYVLVAVALLLIIVLHLLPALLAGLLFYELVRSMAPLLGRRISGDGARMLVVAVLGVIVVGLLIALIIGALSFFRSELGNPELLWRQQLMPLVDKARQQLPAMLVDHLPDSVDALRVGALELVRRPAGTLQLAGKGAARGFAHIIIGLVLGAIIALSRMRPAHKMGPMAAALSRRTAGLAAAFRNIVFAQIKISLSNTVFTAALVFLILIHKLGYFRSARIVGTPIRARAWQLRLGMLVIEAAFGLP